MTCYHPDVAKIIYLIIIIPPRVTSPYPLLQTPSSLKRVVKHMWLSRFIRNHFIRLCCPRGWHIKSVCLCRPCRWGSYVRYLFLVWMCVLLSTLICTVTKGDETPPPPQPSWIFHPCQDFNVLFFFGLICVLSAFLSYWLRKGVVKQL